jgi:hypothetical protein
VDGITYNGTALAKGTADLIKNGPADFAFVETTTTARTIGSGSDTLVLKISQDAYKGDAQYSISVDGKQIGGTLTAKALHSAGQNDIITVKGDWAAGSHKVTINFLNDAWGGSASLDRNLHVDGITYNGTALAKGTADLIKNGPADFAFVETATAPASVDQLFA